MNARLDLTIIGAGLHGLCMAKTYSEVHPDAEILIIDSASSIGGTWAKERLYPGLKTNNPIGTYEFSDFPMVPEDWNIKPGDFIPGVVVNKYLNASAKKYGVTQKCRLNTRVTDVEMKENDSWNLEWQSGQQTGMINARKLVMATGLTSDAKMPVIEGLDTFKGTVFHSKDLASRAHELSSAPDIVVIGGSKSGYDVVNLCCTQTAAQCHWIIRESGHGPSWLAPIYVTPFKQQLDKLTTTRLLTWFNPCIWSSVDGYTWPQWFLQQTRLGRLVSNAFWKMMTDDVTALMGYNNHTETQKLKPRNPAYWVAGSLAIQNYDEDPLAFVRNGRAMVSRSDIMQVNEHELELTNGTRIPADAIVCCTGWDWTPSVEVKPTELRAALSTDGLAQEEQRIFEELPLLKQRPCQNMSVNAVLPEDELHLYRFMLPIAPKMLQARNFAFVGRLFTISTCCVAQLQALWITAFLDGRLDSLTNVNEQTMEAVRSSTASMTAYVRLRHPPEAGGFGDRVADMAFESLPYMDLLLRDLGLNWMRKKGWLSWVRDMFEPYDQSDYIGVVQEWLQKKSAKDCKYKKMN